MKQKIIGENSVQNGTSDSFSNQRYNIGLAYPAVVKKIQDNRVLFEMAGKNGLNLKAAYFVKGHHINPHTVFQKGKNVQVKILRQHNFKQNALGIDFEVIPELLPIDHFYLDCLRDNRFVVEAVIHRITGATMVVELAPNVYATAKRCPHARTFMKVLCKIDRYSAAKRALSVRILKN